VFGILGLCAMVRVQTLSWRVLAVDVPVMMLATLALVPIMRSQGMISRREGALLLMGYATYVATLLKFG